MKPKRHSPTGLTVVLVCIVSLVVIFPINDNAHGFPAWWGSNHWWDWSDYRANIGMRFSMPRLTSGSVSWIGKEYDLLSSGGYNFQARPDYFKEGWFTLYVDRLALRTCFEEDHRFNGLIGSKVFSPSEVAPRLVGVAHPPTSINDPQRFSELDVGWTRFGLDLDLIRYPFFRAGINVDRNFEAPIFVNRQDISSALATTGGTIYYDSGTGLFYYLYSIYFDAQPGGLPGWNVQKFTTKQPPVTIGVQAMVVPYRIREIPITAQARVRVPMPFLKKLLQEGAETKITEWEISAGLRPTVWNTSLYAWATFAMGLEIGYRSTSLDMSVDNGYWAVKANWQGFFLQAGLYY